MIGLLMLAATGTATAQDRSFSAQAVRCGIKPNQIVWSTKARGHRQPNLTPSGNLDSLSFSSFKCLMDWGRRTHTKIGFASAPPSP